MAHRLNSPTQRGGAPPPQKAREIEPLAISYKPLEWFKPSPDNPRIQTEAHIDRVAGSIVLSGAYNPAICDYRGNVIVGHARLAAARKLGMASFPVIRLRNLTEDEKEEIRIRDNSLAAGSSWDPAKLTMALKRLSLNAPKFELTVRTGLTTPQLDMHIGAPETTKADALDTLPPTPKAPATLLGDIWVLGRHRLLCGDSRKVRLYPRLMGKRRARLMLTDAPYNVPIGGFVGGSGKIKHKEFAMASGEMTPEEFTAFLELVFGNAAEFCVDGSIAMLFMDWRHMGEMLKAGHAVFNTLLSLCVWVKDRAGMGSFYRSQHELVFVWKLGTAPHINNVELGKHGRSRTTCWNARAAIMAGNNSELSWHPTCKPTSLLMDAIMDATNHGDIVLDVFGGSGSTLIACEKVGRDARLVEYEPGYCDVTIARWEALTGEDAILEDTGETFVEVRARRVEAGENEDVD